MAKPSKSISELKRLILAELGTTSEYRDVSPEALIIVPRQLSWHATLKLAGERIDEARFAAVSEVSRRLAASYDLRTGAIPGNC